VDKQSPQRRAVVLCTDRNMLIPALFVADAVAAHAGAERAFDIVIVTDPEAAGETERRWMADHGIRHHVEDFADLKAVIKLEGRLTTATLVKLILAQIFDGQYDRILYLDTDLTIHGDVSGLFDLDLGGFAVAAASGGGGWATQAQQEENGKHFAALGMTRPYRYFNTGVLLIDVAAWNRENLTVRALDFVRKYPELCGLPDEDSLNAVLDGRVARFSPIWNMPPRRLWLTLLHGAVDPVIIHYSGPDKPWRRFGRHKRLFPDGQAWALYRSFIARSPWKGWLRTQWGFHDLRRSLKHEFSLAWRAVRGRSREPRGAELAMMVERFADGCRKNAFIDVEQGVTTRADGRLRLAARRGAAPAERAEMRR
jgi:lipopolysaccharide biosynthesis glycosyltransferase